MLARKFFFLDELGEVERGPCEGMNTEWMLPAVLVNVGKLNFGEDFWLIQYLRGKFTDFLCFREQQNMNSSTEKPATDSSDLSVSVSPLAP
jgi:hypothetical protein